MITSYETPFELLEELRWNRETMEPLRHRHPDDFDFIQGLKSSYSTHIYSELFYGLIRKWKPSLYVEFGVLSGYSLLAVALALRDNGKGAAIGVDLFENYAFNMDFRAAVQARIAALGVDKVCTLLQGSVLEIPCEAYCPDVLHVDISNDGQLVRKLFDRWKAHVARAFIFEGGGPSRDTVDWMIRYGKDAMYPVFDEIDREGGWSVHQVLAFPTLTLLVRKS